MEFETSWSDNVMKVLNQSNQFCKADCIYLYVDMVPGSPLSFSIEHSCVIEMQTHKYYLFYAEGTYT